MSLQPFEKRERTPPETERGKKEDEHSEMNLLLK